MSLPASGAARTGLLSLGIGLAAAGAGAALGLAAERVAVGRPLLGGPSADPTEIPFGSVRSSPQVVDATDGTGLHVEVDELDQPDPDGLTVVFCHGYSLNLDLWHYQRLALRGRYRAVFWDQRGHGRSRRGPVGSATIDQVGADLRAVLAATAPRGPLVLIGHSMGGMTIMSLAAADQDLFGDRVVGVVFVATSAGELGDLDLGLDRVGRLVHRVAPKALKLLSRRPGIVERGRKLGGDLESVLVRRYSYASDVSDELVDFTARMIAATRIEVIGDFLPAFRSHDKREALSALAGIETLVVAGDSDLMIPAEHGAQIVRALPHAEHVVVRDAGHNVMLEHPEVVTPHLLALLDRARRAARDARQGGAA